MAARSSKVDPAVATHLEWLGFVRPTGLVVSAPALAQAGVGIKRADTESQNRLRECVKHDRDDQPRISDFRAFATSVLGWDFSPEGYVGTDETPIPAELELHIPDTDDRIRPAFAVRLVPVKRRRDPKLPPDARNTNEEGDPAEWQLLVNTHTPTENFDAYSKREDRTRLSPHRAMEHLLRHTGTSAGLLFNGTTLRLISAPRGENSGWIDFQVADMLTTDGRLILSAMCALLGQTRLLASGAQRNLTFLLRESRKYQNTVSEHLAEQVLHALYELVRGFQIANRTSKNVLLQRLLDEDPDEIYGGLLTLIMRLIFLLYSEERDMLPQDDVYENSYSLAGLHQRLQEDAALYPDTMDQRFGAYAQIVSLSRIIHKGAKFGTTQLPKRQGNLFDPERYCFLEGRDASRSTGPADTTRVIAPCVPDGTIYRVLDKLTVLHSERISYRALNVEHIGAVYETMMGFRLEIATGQSISIKSVKRYGAPTTIDVSALLDIPPPSRAKWVLEKTDRKITDKQKRLIQESSSLDDMLIALGPITDRNATPDFVPPGAMILQPSEERKRTGSHYTPRELSDPIVAKTLEPVFDQLEREQNGPPTPNQILDVKVCDPAMGSGAFLVAACRLLGDKLVNAWHVHCNTPEIPTDETEEVLAYRLVAQRCLYGVDRNPKAVELAKMSLWLFTLAKDHPLTFLDHALRHGDSLVGLTEKQILAFNWKKSNARFQAGLETKEIECRLEKAKLLRQQIRNAGNQPSNLKLHALWHQAESELDHVRIYGDLLLAAFFDGARPRDRENLRMEFVRDISDGNIKQYRGWIFDLKHKKMPLAPFHWDIECPEVFDRHNPGFDAIVGNPPFLGGSKITATLGLAYRDWLATLHEDSTNSADLAARFFRRAFDLIRKDGALGLIATNTISQGDTRATGLRAICNSGGNIYCAKRRVRWPGLAAVVTSVIHIFKGEFVGQKLLDDEKVSNVSAFLFHQGGNDDPIRLNSNLDNSFLGMNLRGMGFTFDDTDSKGVATSLAEMRRLTLKDPRNKDVIFPYIGGEEVNSDPNHAHHRYVIDFGDYPLRRENLGKDWQSSSDTQRDKWHATGIVPSDFPDPVAEDWPDLIEIVQQKVRPERQRLGNSAEDSTRKTKWWQFARTRPALRSRINGMQRIMATSQISKYMAMTFLPASMVHASTLLVFAFDSYSAFCVLQSRVHEVWASFFGSTFEDRLIYTPSDCFETFPFPKNWENCDGLSISGEKYFSFRAQLMSAMNEGLTKIYNRFHDPNESSPEIQKLRELHADMDREVLKAYSWEGNASECDFFLEYEIDEATSKRERMKPYRFRWSDSVRSEILSRLLALNQQRAVEEGQA